jgi:hypothetical protein
MTEDKAGDFMDIHNMDMDLDLLDDEDQAVEADNTAGVSAAYTPGDEGGTTGKGAPTDRNMGGREMLGSKTNTKLTYAIDSFTSPTQVLAPIATALTISTLRTPANMIIPLEEPVLLFINNANWPRGNKPGERWMS